MHGVLGGQARGKANARALRSEYRGQRKRGIANHVAILLGLVLLVLVLGILDL